MAGTIHERGVSPVEKADRAREGRDPAALELRNISKDFGDNRALHEVGLRIDRGEVVALVGQNGSGKSTIVKVLSGFHAPEPGGQLLVSGEEVPLPLAMGQASEIGLSFVYQNLALAGGLSVLENLNLVTRVRSGIGAWSPIHWRQERRRARNVLERYGVALDLGKSTRDLPPVDQARLAIVRAAEELRRFRERTGFLHSVLVLDEPTVFLPEEDIQFLFELVRTVVGEGAGVLFISHDLAAIREIADRIIVLRDGKVVEEAYAGDVDEEMLVDLIVGAQTRKASSAPAQALSASVDGRSAEEPATPPTTTPLGVTVDRLAGRSLRDLSFTIGPAEIVGLAGLIGSGAEDVPYLLFGAALASSGTLRLGGKSFQIPQLTPEKCVRQGIALVPADRQVFGISAPLTIWENMVMLIEDSHYRQGIFHRRELVELAQGGIEAFVIRPPRAHVPAGTLSGGNQQKVVLAKWLFATPQLLVLHEPTQGVDVGARRDIYRFVKAAAARDQTSVLWVTTDFGELAEVCDRVIVCGQGRQIGELAGDELSDDSINAAVLRQGEEAG